MLLTIHPPQGRMLGGVERYDQCNSDRAPARSGTPPPQPTEVLVAVARKPGKPLLLGDPLIDCRDAARQRIFTGCILADSRFSCLANSSEERSHNDGHSILPGRRQTLRRKCDRRPDWAHSAATLASHAEEAGSQALAPTQRRSVLSIPRQSGRMLIPSPLVQVQPNPGGTADRWRAAGCGSAARSASVGTRPGDVCSQAAPPCPSHGRLPLALGDC